MVKSNGKIQEIDLVQRLKDKGCDYLFVDLDVISKELDTANGVLVRNGIIIILCAANGGEIEIDGKKYKLLQNSVVILPENHIINTISPMFVQGQSIIAVPKDYILNMPSPIDTSIFSYSRYMSVLSVTDDKFDDLKNYFRFLYKESNESSKYQREIVQSIFYALILEIVGEYEKIFDMDNEASNIKANTLSDSFFRLLAVNYKRHRSVRFYADKLNLTPKYLSTAIKRATGRPILDWIHEAILVDAKMLLHTTDLTVQQISEQLNFSSPSAFVQFFKKHTGKTPRKI